jgi:hypothetical protein
MPNFKFIENAEAIYEKSISSTPFPFRKTMKNGLIELLMEQYGEDKEISEAMLVDMIKENTPSAFVGLGLDAIRSEITDPELADI